MAPKPIQSVGLDVRVWFCDSVSKLAIFNKSDLRPIFSVTCISVAVGRCVSVHFPLNILKSKSKSQEVKVVPVQLIKVN